MNDHDGHYSSIDGRGLRVMEVFSSSVRPRLAGDDCGCERMTRLGVTGGPEFVVLLCEEHGREPGIIHYMLPLTDRRLRHGDQIPLMKIQPPTEKEEERLCIDLYEQVGLVVIKISQPHKATGMTRGIADTMILDPKRKAFWWHEVKRRQGPEYYYVKSVQSEHQKLFQHTVEMVGHRYIIGPVSTAEQELIERGIVR